MISIQASFQWEENRDFVRLTFTHEEFKIAIVLSLNGLIPEPSRLFIYCQCTLSHHGPPVSIESAQIFGIQALPAGCKSLYVGACCSNLVCQSTRIRGR